MNRPSQCRVALRRLAILVLLASPAASCSTSASRDLATEPFPRAQKEVEETLLDLLAAAGRKDFVRLESLHLYGPKFSKWDATGPRRLDADATRLAERAGIEPLDSFRATFEDLKVDVFGDTAITTYLMPYEASAGGRTMRSKARATLVWVRIDSGWKVAHEHFSPLGETP